MKATSGKIMNTGTMAMMVEAIPTSMRLRATMESDTPRKGPKKAPGR